MVQFGVCAAPEKSAEIQQAGFAFVEVNTQDLLQGLVPDEQWTGLARAKASVLPVPSCNVMMPGSLKITGPAVDGAALTSYMTTILRRARQIGIRRVVFGSAGSRNVPEGFDRTTARQQIVEFLTTVAPLAQAQDVTIVVEPLNRGESNIINGVAEAMEYVRAVDHPHVQCLVDSYHFWLDDNALDTLAAAMPWIKHVHVADKVGRVAPGESGQADYRPFFRVLKQGGYDGLIAVEAKFDDIAGTGRRVHDRLLEQWGSA